MSEPVIYRVGDLLVDTGRRTVHRGAQEIPLPKLSFDLLLVLLESAPNVVSTDRFMDTVWRGLVVSPETVGQRVKLLRDALDDEPKNPTYIAGVRGLGYRLIAPLTLDQPVQGETETGLQAAPAAPSLTQSSVTTTSSLDAAAVSPLAPVPRRRRRLIAWVGAAAMLALVAGTAWVKLKAPGHSVTVVGAPYRAVVVLPFASLGADHHDDYIAGGLSEMVQNRLAGISTLQLVGHSSSQSARDQNFSLDDMKFKLHARYVVDGSLQRAGDQLRVTAQITDVESGRQFAALHLDKPVSAIFALQDEIADHIAVALAMRAGDARKFRPEQARNATSAAYLEYLQGRAFMEHFNVTSMEHAAEHFSKAIELDPKFAAAYAGLGLAIDWSTLGRLQRDEKVRARVHQLTEQALALDDQLGEAYAARAQQTTESDPQASEADYRRAIELSPSYSNAYIFYAESLRDWGRKEESLQMLDLAQQIDPLAPRISYVRALYLTMGGSPEEERRAMALLREVITLDPNFSNAYARLAQFSAVWYGEYAEGSHLLEKALQVDPRAVWYRDDAVDTYLMADDPAAVRSLIADSGGHHFFGELCLPLYNGNWREAAEVEFRRPAGDDFDAPSGLAIELWGINTRQIDRAVDHIRRAVHAEPGREFNAESYDVGMFIGTLLREKGDLAGAHAVANAALAWVKDYDDEKSLESFATVPFVRAEAHVLLGQYDLALQELDRGLHTKTARPMMPWGWMMAYDALWNPVRNDPRFVAALQFWRGQAAVQHAKLVELRARGEIPERR